MSFIERLRRVPTLCLGRAVCPVAGLPLAGFLRVLGPLGAQPGRAGARHDARRPARRPDRRPRLHGRAAPGSVPGRPRHEAVRRAGAGRAPRQRRCSRWGRCWRCTGRGWACSAGGRPCWPTLALGTMPLFFLQARQLTSDMPLIAGLALALGGLGRYAWPADGRRRLQDLVVGAAGMSIGTLSGGALLGVALPALAVAGTVAVAWGLTPAELRVAGAPARLTAPGLGPDVPAGRSFGRGLLASPRGIVVLVIGAVGLLVLLLTLTQANVAGQYSLLLGGTPRGGTPPQKFEYLIRQIGFGVFPWSALVVFALGRALVRLGEDDGGKSARAGLRPALPAGVRRLRLRPRDRVRAHDRRGALRAAGPAGAGGGRLPRRGARGRAGRAGARASWWAPARWWWRATCSWRPKSWPRCTS